MVGPLLFVLVLIFESAFYAWVTLRSGSVWPAVLCHAASNASAELMWIFFGGELNPLIGPGNQGIIGSLGYAVLALVIFLSPRALAQPTQAPADRALVEDPGAPGPATGQPKLGTGS